MSNTATITSSQFNQSDVTSFHGDFVVVSEGSDHHVFDVSQPEGSTDQWQQRFDSQPAADDYARLRSIGGTVCLLSHEGHSLPSENVSV